MICPECRSNMYIETWEGWIWMCPYCDYKGREASDDEIKLQEESNAEYLHGLLQNNAE